MKWLDKHIKTILFVFILIQPCLDLISYNSVVTGIFSISSIIKPFVIYGLTAYVVLLKNFKHKNKIFIWLLAFAGYSGLHLIMFYFKDYQLGLIISEFRFLLNLGYSMCSFVLFYYLYETSEEKTDFINSFMKLLVQVVLVYAFVVFISIAFNISTLTYEHADPYKLGYKGLFNNGSILGHMFILTLPIMIYYLFFVDQKINVFLKLFAIAIVSYVVWNIGTKVTFFSIFLICVPLVFATVYTNLMSKKTISRNVILTFVATILIFGATYTFSPTYKNTVINSLVSEASMGKVSSEIKDSSKSETFVGRSETDEFVIAHNKAMNDLNELYRKYPDYMDGSDNRQFQVFYTALLYRHLPLEYKFLGTGYRLLPLGLQPENDMVMLMFNFGPLAFLIVLLPYLLITLKLGLTVLFKLFKPELLQIYTLLAIMLFFAISSFAGYTITYTNYSIYLAIVFVVALYSLDALKAGDDNE